MEPVLALEDILEIPQTAIARPQIDSPANGLPSGTDGFDVIAEYF